MSDKELPKEIVTIGDLCNYLLGAFPANTPVLKSEIALGGYNRIKIWPPILFTVRANDNPALDVEFIDHFSTNPVPPLGETLQAVVL